MIKKTTLRIILDSSRPKLARFLIWGVQSPSAISTKPPCGPQLLSEKDSQVASSVPVVDRQAQRMLGLFHMKQSAARPAHAPTRSARLARVVAEANGKAPAGVRLIDTQRSLSPGEVQRGKVLERMARRIRENGDKNLEARTRRVADGGDPTLKKVSRRVKPQ
jgi:hypothetical protein